MERFDVEGTSLVSWTIRLHAHDEREAVEEAERIAGRIGMRSSLATVNAAQHRIVGWGSTGSEGK
jgi:hypothetical protein